MSDEPGLTEGGRYSVKTKDTVSEGVFTGYAMIGTESAVMIRLDDGRTRMIPAVMIYHIDIIGTAERKEEKKQAYYG